MNWKATLAAAFVMFAVVACNLPGAQPTAAPPTAPLPTETVEQAATAEPAETSTEPPAATDTAPPPATPAPTVEEPERVSFETGATSATVEGEVEAGGTDEYLIYVLAGQEMTIVLATVAQNLSLTVEAPDGTELPSTVGEGNEWVSVVPETGDYLVRVESGESASAAYSLSFSIPPLEQAAICDATTQAGLKVHRWASAVSEVFGTAQAGTTLAIQAETPDGWYGFDPGVAQAPNFGLDRLRWVLPGQGGLQFEAGCPDLPVVLSLDQLRNATYRALDFEPVALTNGEYRSTSDPMTHQVTVLRDDVMSYSDLDGDGDEDALVVLGTNTGGSGTFIELVAVANENGQPEFLGKTLLGDRVPVHHITVIDGVIHVQATIHDDDDPLCCPTQDVELRFRFEDGEFVFVDE